MRPSIPILAALVLILAANQVAAQVCYPPACYQQPTAAAPIVVAQPAPIVAAQAAPIVAAQAAPIVTAAPQPQPLWYLATPSGLVPQYIPYSPGIELPTTYAYPGYGYQGYNYGYPGYGYHNPAAASEAHALTRAIERLGRGSRSPAPPAPK
jgi:hypothetical protein